MSNAILSQGRLTLQKSLIKRGILSFSPLTKGKYEEHGIKRIASNADVGQLFSIQVANALAEKLENNLGVNLSIRPQKKRGQTLGNEFEKNCEDFLNNTFKKLFKLRPGKWEIKRIAERNNDILGQYEQYSHLLELNKLANKNKELKSFLGDAYTVSPDIIITRIPEPDEVINDGVVIVDDKCCHASALRAQNHQHPNEPSPIMHASISCKFTMRSDRAQNTRTEALNLIRSRKGRSPHIVSVTAEPMPQRIASLALGTGDLDCVYHIALYELLEVIKNMEGREDSSEQLQIMIDGKRLKDISDLPLDLAI